jgi:hypothetical protein
MIIDNTIDPNLIKEFKNSLHLVDSFESYSSQAKISNFRIRKKIKIIYIIKNIKMDPSILKVLEKKK